MPLARFGVRGAGYLEPRVRFNAIRRRPTDHFAGSAAAIELIAKLRSTNGDGEFGACLAELELDVEADRAALEQVMEALEVSPSAIKVAGGWLLRRPARLSLTIGSPAANT